MNRKLLKAERGMRKVEWPAAALRVFRLPPSAFRLSKGFVLLEAMLAVVVFSLGVLALGACVGNCLSAERLKQEDVRAGRILANRMAEIEGGVVVIGSDSGTEQLKGMGEGMTLKTTRTLVKKKNEKGQDLTNLYLITLTLGWESDHEKQSRELMFYVHPKRR